MPPLDGHKLGYSSSSGKLSNSELVGDVPGQASMYAIAHWIYNTCVTLRPAPQNQSAFDPAVFLATIGKGRKAMVFSKKQAIFTQGEPADAIFYLRTGKIKLTVYPSPVRKQRSAY